MLMLFRALWFLWGFEDEAVFGWQEIEELIKEAITRSDWTPVGLDG